MALPQHLARRRFLQYAAALGLAGALIEGPAEADADSATSGMDAAGIELFVANGTLEAGWLIDGGSLRGLRLRDKHAGADLQLPTDLFVLTLADGSVVRSSRMKIVDGPKFDKIRADRHAIRRSEQTPGATIRVRLADPATDATVTWVALLRDGSKYVRQEVTIEAGPKTDLSIREIALCDVDLPAKAPRAEGTVKGSPVVAGNFYLGFEHPLSTATVEGTRVRCFLPRQLPLQAGHRFACSSVIGVAAPGQMRRDFLKYIESERAHPYRTFLHYNSWFDIGYENEYSAADAVGVIHAFGEEMSRKRRAKIDSFLFDDGWDDPHTLWGFNSGFPDGFAPLRAAAGKFGAAPGVWMSPWGGYANALQERLKYGRAAAFETNDRGFALSGPKYFDRFRNVCVNMIKKYGVNQFKFDGTGNVNDVIPGSAFDSDFHAMIGLIDDLRNVKPDLFVNLTTGTSPSPFWLRSADSIWRGGYDTNFAGVGSNRQQWNTYRDQQTYHGIVQKGPLYPLNSLMLHGVVFAKHAAKLGDDPENAFANEVRSYFGSGTQLQEMYVTPSLLRSENWDVLAQAAKWSRANADTLVDSHWVGGDPSNGDIYGWGAWSPRKGIVTLRNPTDAPKGFDLDIRQAFELPAGAPEKYLATNPWATAGGAAPIALAAGQPHEVTLQPFEVVTLDAMPVG